MTIWVVFGLMAIVAVAFVAKPLSRNLPVVATAVVFIAASSVALYQVLGSPDVPSGAGQLPDVEAMVESLAARLENQPDDLQGWKMLGRSYMNLGDYPKAREAFEKAVALENAQNGQTLVSLGEAMLAGDEQQLSSETIAVFENALALEPNNPGALFWSGMGAASRGNLELAAERWEGVLATNPPPEIETILRQRIAEWRGEEPAVPSSVQMATQAIVSATVEVSDEAAASLPVEATVFVIARDPKQPTPPIAVTRRQLSELPAQIELSDRESMIPGRTLSNFSEFELIARVSVSGQPIAQTGDWFASQIVRPADGDPIVLSISEQVQ